MSVAEVVVYPRGFMGFNIGLPMQNKAVDLAKIMDSIRLNTPLSKAGKPSISNSQVETNWKSILSGDRYVRSFGFQEQIINTALNAFGTDSFLNWCNLQNSNPYFTDMHKRFMNDTFNFLNRGQRAINIQQWMSIISVRQPNKTDANTPYNYIGFFGLSERLEYRRSEKLVAAIQDWVSKPNGYTDLAGALHILFGENTLG